MNQVTNAIVGIVVLILIIAGGYALYSNRNAEGDVAGEQVAEEEQVVTVGFLNALRDDVAYDTESIRFGVEMAVAENDLTGVNVVDEEVACDSEAAADAFARLVDEEGAVAVISALCPDVSAALAPIASERQVVLVNVADTVTAGSENGAYVFRTVPQEDVAVAFAAQTIVDDGVTSLAILYSDDAAGVQLNEGMESAFRALGGDIAVSQSYTAGSTDVESELAAVEAVAPDALYIIGSATSSAAAILKQAQETELSVPLYGTSVFKNEAVIAAAGAAAEGLTIIAVDAGDTDFITRFSAMFGSEPRMFAAQAYDAMTALASVVRDGAISGEDIHNALRNLSFTGISGLITFDENGDVGANYEALIVRDGTFVTIESIDSAIVEDESDDVMMEEDAAIEESTEDTLDDSDVMTDEVDDAAAGSNEE